MKKQKYVHLGKAGAKKRWASRYETLQELSGFCDKHWLNYFTKWPTKHLEALVCYVKLLTYGRYN